MRALCGWLLVAGIAGVTLFPVPSTAQGKRPEMTPEVIRERIRVAVEYLKNAQQGGDWERTVLGVGGNTGGVTSLVLLALLESGVDPNEECIQKGLSYLRKVEPRETYVVALQTMVFAHAFPEKDKLLIKRNVDWLQQTLVRDTQGRLQGWSYPVRGQMPDNSNSQYAVLALREAGLAGAPISDQLWKDILEFYKRTQLQNGGWPYRNHEGFGQDDRLTMTSAGVCGLLIAGMQLYRNNEIIEKDGITIRNCGKFERNDPLARGLERIAEKFTVTANVGEGWKFYNLYGLERAGRLSGQRFFVGPGGNLKVDWYRAGAEHLINTQFPEGCWRSNNSVDGNPIIATSFSLLFLAKGKTPVLIHKMMHGTPADLRSLTGDWNNDRNDVRNLTEFCSQKLFRNKKTGRPLPLTWQVFNAAQLNAGSDESVKEMLQAPILYFNGHQAPQFTDGEKHLLRQYVDQGGFIFAEACCGPNAISRGFDTGFRRLIKELWPDRELAPLADSHAIWSSAFAVKPGSFKLEGIDFGCKTSLVYAPEDLSCHWETNRTDDNADGRTVMAFRVGGNIVAYATGLEPPEDKLSRKEVVSTAEDKIERNYFQAAQIDYGGRDWQPAPRAMRNLTDYLHKTEGIDVILQTRPLVLSDPNLSKFKFLYMHGRREFTIDEPQRKALREHLDGGGLLLADACCGSEAFDKSFRAFIKDTFGRDLQPIDRDDTFFTAKVGKDIKSAMGRTQKGAPYAPMTPQFEGIRADSKQEKSPWIVIYSRYDLGCALDKHASPDCLGYNHESALELAAQAVLYVLKE